MPKLLLIKPLDLITSTTGKGNYLQLFKLYFDQQITLT